MNQGIVEGNQRNLQEIESFYFVVIFCFCFCFLFGSIYVNDWIGLDMHFAKDVGSLSALERLRSMDSKVFPSTVSSNNVSSSKLPKGPSSSTLVPQNSGLDKLRKLADRLDPMELDDRNKNQLELLRLRMKDFFHHHFVGGVYQMILLFLSVISVFQYIYGTYVDNYNSPRMNRVESIMSKMELVFAGVFGFDWCLNLFLADNRISHLTSFFSMIDLLTVIPTFASYQQHCPRFHHSMTAEEIIYYILCGMVTTRILRALRVRSRFLFIEDEVQQALANMGLNIAVMILYSKFFHFCFCLDFCL